MKVYNIEHRVYLIETDKEWVEMTDEANGTLFRFYDHVRSLPYEQMTEVTSRSELDYVKKRFHEMTTALNTILETK